MKRDAMRDFCRQQSGLDDSDVSVTLLDTLLREGWERTLAKSETWPFMESSWVRSVTAGDETVTAPSDMLRYVALVRDNGQKRKLARADLGVAEIQFQNTSGVPTHFSEWGDEFYLFPKPAQDMTVTIRGYRRGQDTWLTNATLECDADSRLHVPICWHTISAMFGTIEEFESSDFYFRSWSSAVDEFQTQIMRGAGYGGLVLAQGPFGGGVFSPAKHGTWDV